MRMSISGFIGPKQVVDGHGASEGIRTLRTKFTSGAFARGYRIGSWGAYTNTRTNSRAV